LGKHPQIDLHVVQQPSISQSFSKRNGVAKKQATYQIAQREIKV